MKSEKIQPPSLYELSDVFHREFLKKYHNNCYKPEIWTKFLKECGILHATMDRVKIVDKQKWFLAKIKYGI